MAKFKVGDIVRWADDKDRNLWIDAHIPGPFVVTRAWPLKRWVSVRSLSTGKMLTGSQLSPGIGAYSDRAFEKDEFLSAVHQRGKRSHVRARS